MEGIRNLAIEDRFALDHWDLVADNIVTSPLDRKRVSNLWASGEFGAAILLSLQSYESSKEGHVNDLVQIFRNWNMNKLAKAVEEYFNTEDWLVYRIKHTDAIDLLGKLSYLEKCICLRLFHKIFPDNEKPLETLIRVGAVRVRLGEGIMNITRWLNPSKKSEQEEFRILSFIVQSLDKLVDYDTFGEEEKEIGSQFVALWLHIKEHYILVGESHELIRKIVFKLSVRGEPIAAKIGSESVPTVVAHLGLNNKTAIVFQCGIILALNRVRDCDGAKALLDPLLEQFAMGQPDHIEKVVDITQAHASTLLDSGKCGEELLKLAEIGLDKTCPDDTCFTYYKAAALRGMGKLDEALALMEYVVPEVERRKGRHTRDYFDVATLLAELIQEAALRRASNLLIKVYNGHKERFGPEHPGAVETLNKLKHDTFCYHTEGVGD